MQLLKEGYKNICLYERTLLIFDKESSSKIFRAYLESPCARMPINIADTNPGLFNNSRLPGILASLVICLR